MRLLSQLPTELTRWGACAAYFTTGSVVILHDRSRRFIMASCLVTLGGLPRNRVGHLPGESDIKEVEEYRRPGVYTNYEQGRLLRNDRKINWQEVEKIQDSGPTWKADLAVMPKVTKSVKIQAETRMACHLTTLFKTNRVKLGPSA
jgi:hypothetical protein